MKLFDCCCQSLAPIGFTTKMLSSKALRPGPSFIVDVTRSLRVFKVPTLRVKAKCFFCHMLVVGQRFVSCVYSDDSSDLNNI